jgi:hypothetical protein
LDALAPDVDRADPIVGETRWPTEDRAAYYDSRKQQFQLLYEAVIAAATDR